MVQADQILVSRMLRLANSPFYNRGNKIQNIRQTITRLGFKTVRSMVAMAFADSIFSTGVYKKFREEVFQTQQSLKEVRKNLRREIESLGVRLKAYNIIGIPLLVAAFGIGRGLWIKKTR